MDYATELLMELSKLWHISRVPAHGRYNRMLWVANEFSKAHPAFTSTAAYKAIDRMTALLPLSNDPETLRFINQVLDAHTSKDS